MSVQYDLDVDQGSTLRKVVIWKDSNGTPINLTGYRVMFQVRPFASSSTVLVWFDSDNLTVGQSLDPLGSSGEIAFELSDEITSTLPPGILKWDLIVEAPDGSRDRIVFGSVHVSEAVTRGS